VIDDVACVATSFPSFADIVNGLAGTDAIRVEA
jgi:5-enolpyruvylshikimate-3-phosphate synthase